ncbi:DUF202 domain-containing protein [Planosporangium sp. 12N6]|uniref:DUF202 domain-containing protein n=1 Tax=Planosporangium spinosum TaxID=3402278 RepID=UPI003CED5415
MSGGSPDEPGRPDPGRQPERTRLSWRRTVLAATAVSILAVRLAAGTRLTARGALGVAAVAALWLLVVTVAHRRIGALTADRPRTAGRSAPVLTAAVVGYAVVGAVLLLLRSG